jgi:hypothetical protein
VICVLEPLERATRADGKATVLGGKSAPRFAVQAQGTAPSCISVVSRWADTHGRLDFATFNLSTFKASQKCRSKQGRKTPAPEGERVKRRPGAKQRKHSRHLELCRAARRAEEHEPADIHPRGLRGPRPSGY